MPGRKWFPCCLSAAPAHGGLADRLWRCSGKWGAVCPQGHALPCLQALHVRPGNSGPLSQYSGSSLSVAWYSLWFSGLRHFAITSLMLAGELWWQTEGEVLRMNQQTSEFAPRWNKLWHDQKHSLCFDPYMFEQTWVQVTDKSLPKGSVLPRSMIWLYPMLTPQSKPNWPPSYL